MSEPTPESITEIFERALDNVRATPQPDHYYVWMPEEVIDALRLYPLEPFAAKDPVKRSSAAGPRNRWGELR